MKLTIIGGGGFRVPLVYKALLADRSPARVTQLMLYDTDEVRLRAIAEVLYELEKQGEDPPSSSSPRTWRRLSRAPISFFPPCGWGAHAVVLSTRRSR